MGFFSLRVRCAGCGALSLLWRWIPPCGREATLPRGRGCGSSRWAHYRATVPPGRESSIAASPSDGDSGQYWQLWYRGGGEKFTSRGRLRHMVTARVRVTAKNMTSQFPLHNGSRSQAEKEVHLRQLGDAPKIGLSETVLSRLNGARLARRDMSERIKTNQR